MRPELRNTLKSSERPTRTISEWQPANLGPLRKVIPQQNVEVTEQGLETFDRMLFALGNADPKCAVLLYGVSPVPARTFEIIAKLEDQLPPGTWIPNHNRLNQYFKKSMLPAGIVEKGTSGGRSTYETNPLGEELGKDTAAILLDWASQEGVSISDFLGFKNTASEAGMCVYLNRCAILLTAYHSPTFVADIIRRTSLPKSSIQQNMQELNSTGLIEYDSVNTEVKGWGIYERIGEEENVPVTSKNNRLRQNTVGYFRENAVGNPLTIARALGRNDEIDIYKILSELTEVGFLKQQKWRGGEQQSDAVITDKGRKFVDAVILPLLKACSGDKEALAALAQMKDYMEAHPELAGRAIDSYVEARQRIPLDDTKQALLEHIQQNGPQRPTDLVATFGGRVEAVFPDLLKTNNIIRHTFGKAVYYGLPETPPPEHVPRTIVFSYTKPEELVPPTCRPKETYYMELFTTDFWNGLTQDIARVPKDIASESKFYRFFDPDVPNWYDKDDFKTGKYLNHIIALRGMGIEKPSRFLREFAVYEAPQELITAITNAQDVMRRNLIETIEYRTRDDYVQELHTTRFWEQLIQDLQMTPPDTTPYHFFMHFNRNRPREISKGEEGNYHTMYLTLARALGNGVYFLNEFNPTLPHEEGLTPLIRKAQDMMQERLRFIRPEITSDEWIASLGSDEFWEEFQSDIAHCSEDQTFGNFIAFFNDKNSDLSKKTKQDGKDYLGKYYTLGQMLRDKGELFLELPSMEDLPHDLTSNELIRWLMYRNAPIAVKDALLYRFPGDFYPLDDKEMDSDFNPELTRLTGMYPELVTGEYKDIVTHIDSLAGTSLTDKQAILIYSAWMDNPSPQNMKRLAERLHVNQAQIYNAINLVHEQSEFKDKLARLNILIKLSDGKKIILPISSQRKKDQVPDESIQRMTSLQETLTDGVTPSMVAGFLRQHQNLLTQAGLKFLDPAVEESLYDALDRHLSEAMRSRAEDERLRGIRTIKELLELPGIELRKVLHILPPDVHELVQYFRYLKNNGVLPSLLATAQEERNTIYTRQKPIN